MDDSRDAYGSETYGHGEVENYVEPRRPTGPSDVEVRRTIRAQLWKRVAIGALVGALMFMLGGIGYTTHAVRQQQIAATGRLKVIQATATDARHATERIEDCTTPGSGCFEQGQKRAAALVVGLNDTSTRAASAAAACADQPDRQTYRQILTCVTAALKSDSTKRQRAEPDATPPSAPKTKPLPSRPHASGPVAVKPAPAPTPTRAAKPRPKPRPAPLMSTPPASAPTPLLCVLGLCVPSLIP